MVSDFIDHDTGVVVLLKNHIIFLEEPKGLPPQRTQRHQIPLKERDIACECSTLWISILPKD